MTQPDSTPASDVEVVDEPEHNRFVARIDGATVAYSAYRLLGDRIWFLHTETDERVEGRGIGSRLVAGALDQVRERNLRVIAKCPFVASYIKRHRAYADLLDDRDGKPSASPA